MGLSFIYRSSRDEINKTQDTRLVYLPNPQAGLCKNRKEKKLREYFYNKSTEIQEIATLS